MPGKAFVGFFLGFFRVFFGVFWASVEFFEMFWGSSGFFGLFLGFFGLRICTLTDSEQKSTGRLKKSTGNYQPYQPKVLRCSPHWNVLL